MVRIGFVWLRMETSEHVNESWDYAKYLEILE
jgi:hypothetical protein